MFPPRRHFLGKRFLDQLDLLIRVRPFLAQLDGDEPVDVRVLQVECEPTGTAFAAGLTCPYLCGALATDALREPQCQALFADASRTFEQQDLR